MNLILSVGEWFSQNWMLLVLVAIRAFFVVTTFLKQKKEMNARNELMGGIKKGTKIVTTAGVYGVVEGIEDTTDGKVVTIKTGTSKNPCTMTIHMNAIMGIDNKTSVKGETETVVEESVENSDDDSDSTETIEKKLSPKKSTSKKSSK